MYFVFTMIVVLGFPAQLFLIALYEAHLDELIYSLSPIYKQLGQNEEFDDKTGVSEAFDATEPPQSVRHYVKSETGGDSVMDTTDQRNSSVPLTSEV